MANKTYVSVGGKAKPIRKLYVSVGGKAKPVKRLYGSVGGKAKIIYDTVVVTYKSDNKSASPTTSTERIGKGCLATKKDSKRWYKSDGTEWNFNTAVTSDITLYQTVYIQDSKLSFNGNQYVEYSAISNIQSNQVDFHMDIEVTSTSVPSGGNGEVYFLSIWHGSPKTTGFLLLFSNSGDGRHPETWQNVNDSISWGDPKATDLSIRTGVWYWRLNLRPAEQYNYMQVWQPNGPQGAWYQASKRMPTNTSGKLYICGMPGEKSKGLIGNFQRLYTDGTYDLYPYRKITNGATTYGIGGTKNGTWLGFYERKSI